MKLKLFKFFYYPGHIFVWLAVKHVKPLVCVCLYRCVLAVPYLACLDKVGQEVLLHSFSLTGARSQTKSLSAFMGEVKTSVTLETVGGSQPVVEVAIVGNSSKHILLLEANGFTLYPHQLPSAAKLYVASYEKSSIVLQALYVEGVSIIVQFLCFASI